MSVITGDWPAVEAAVMCGASATGETESRPASPVPNQSGTTLLDKFTHALIVKCTNEVSSEYRCRLDCNSVTKLGSVYGFSSLREERSAEPNAW